MTLSTLQESYCGRGGMLRHKVEINTVHAVSINLIYELFLAETGSYLSKFSVLRGHLVQELDSQPRATVDHLRQIGDEQNHLQKKAKPRKLGRAHGRIDL